MPDLYSVLGLSRRAKSEEIKAAYRALAKRSHPDVNAGDKEAERRIKEINLAYGTLGDPEARAAYDVELGRRRAKARRRFWNSAATGAATFILTAVFFVSVAALWRQRTEIHQSPSDEPALFTSNARKEYPVTKPPADDRADLRSAELAEIDRGVTPSEPVRAPLREPFGEPPRSANSEIASASIRDGEWLTPDEPAAQPSPVLDGSAKDQLPSAESPEPSSTVQSPEGQPVRPAPAWSPPPSTELAHASSPEVGAELPMPTPTVNQTLSGNLPPRDDRKTMAILRIHKKSKKDLKIAEIARSPMPSKLHATEREPRLISSSATAMPFPSAGEPYVNMGVRSR